MSITLALHPLFFTQHSADRSISVMPSEGKSKRTARQTEGGERIMLMVVHASALVCQDTFKQLDLHPKSIFFTPECQWQRTAWVQINPNTRVYPTNHTIFTARQKVKWKVFAGEFASTSTGGKKKITVLGEFWVVSSQAHTDGLCSTSVLCILPPPFSCLRSILRKQTEG